MKVSLLIAALLVAGCSHDIVAKGFVGSDGERYIELLCTDDNWPSECLQWANRKCGTTYPTLVEGTRDTGVANFPVEKVVPDPKVKPNWNRLIIRCRTQR